MRTLSCDVCVVGSGIAGVHEGAEGDPWGGDRWAALVALYAAYVAHGDRAAFMYSLIVTAKMNDVDPQAWLADVLARLPDIPVPRLPELLPWNWQHSPVAKAA